MTTNEKYMLLAIKEGLKGKSAGNLPFGAVVVSGNKVISKDHARNTSTKDVTAHAELLAIRRACRILKSGNLKNCTIYCSNEPCVMCGAAIFQANITQIVIGASRDDLPRLFRKRKIRIKDLARDSRNKVRIIYGVLKDEVLKAFI